MTIDERLERLVERHEALAQSVEMLVTEQRDRSAKVDERMIEMAAAIKVLAGSAANHERRMRDLEGRA